MEGIMEVPPVADESRRSGTLRWAGGGFAWRNSAGHDDSTVIRTPWRSTCNSVSGRESRRSAQHPTPTCPLRRAVSARRN